MSGRKRKSKKKSQQIHAQNRCRQRFGCGFNEKQLVNRIIAGETELVEKQSNRVSIHRVLIQENPANVVYDKTRKTIVTVLYPEESYHDEVYSRLYD